MEIIKETSVYQYENIDDLADQAIESFTILCERAFGKDPMTNGWKPNKALVKAIYKWASKELPDPKRMTKEVFIKDFLDDDD
jgi:hypothetical protein